MNTLIERYGWKFCFDKYKTMKYYESYSDLCQCESCRSFYKNVKLISNDIKNFVKLFGVDITKPIEQEAIIVDKSKNIVENTVYYAVNGEAVSLDNPQIPIGESVVEIIPKEKSPNTDISEPYSVLAVREIWLPWTIDCNINDIYD